MISQQRFEELVELAKKGGLSINEAIKLAAYESIQQDRLLMLGMFSTGMDVKSEIQNSLASGVYAL